MSSSEFRAEADVKIQALASKQAAFGALGPGDRAQLVGELIDSMKKNQDELPSVADACVLSQGHASASDESATGEWCIELITMASLVMSFLTRFKETLETKAKSGACPPPKALRKRADGRTVADVYPLNSADTMKPTKACKCEVWIKPGEEATQGAMFSSKPRADSVGLVLGAGNLGSLGMVDCVCLLFQRNTVVLYKLHHLRTYQKDFVRKLFAPMISKGYFDIIEEQTGVQDSQYLVSHPSLCQIHMTGSTETHDAIVWGAREGREERRRAKKPMIDLEKVLVTSELGCITPYMVCPGDWSDSEIQHHALHLAASCTANNGYYCNSPKMLVLAEGWKQKEAFLGNLRSILSSIPSKAPYYPGSHNRYKAFESAYADKLEKIKGPGFGMSEKFGEHIPWTLVHLTADPQNFDAMKNEHAFKSEPFCPILTVCTLKGVSEPAHYLEVATTLVNRYLWGTLSCTVVVHPKTQEAQATAFDKAVADLEYGSIAINAWSGTAYQFECGAWGAYAGGDPPRETVERIESGVGLVNNCLAFDHLEKIVLTCPFVDKNVQLGTGPKLSREAALNVVNYIINPGLKALVKLLCPTLFKPAGAVAMGALALVAGYICSSALR